MKLIDSSEVCEMLGISKSTLYRWCGIKEANEPLALGVSRGLSIGRTVTAMRGNALDPFGEMLNEPQGFPRPFKIGRAFKWNVAEIKEWLEGQRY
ncbi:helix-turn-helix transcriptional regulator [Pseudomonas fluorescens]|uniref:helix-turn-helix transcriptional regulator n=1 Tax=Pseudomonas fluorescens TaxID=294 RepID=UPI001CA696B8|nr:helix-turn-helix domain-containing protein [Pseudomonas fluorescens]MBY8933185.1 helix-turn-helix domain-containing protein [Pseudomonas fluorescens]